MRTITTSLYKQILFSVCICSFQGMFQALWYEIWCLALALVTQAVKQVLHSWDGLKQNALVVDGRPMKSCKAQQPIHWYFFFKLLLIWLQSKGNTYVCIYIYFNIYIRNIYSGIIHILSLYGLYVYIYILWCIYIYWQQQRLQIQPAKWECYCNPSHGQDPYLPYDPNATGQQKCWMPQAFLQFFRVMHSRSTFGPFKDPFGLLDQPPLGLLIFGMSGWVKTYYIIYIFWGWTYMFQRCED